MKNDRILVYHLGSLGDTLVALPALRAVRENFPLAHITLLTDLQSGKNRVQCHDILEGSGLIDDYILYKIDNSFLGKALYLLRMAKLLVVIRKRGIKTLIYLVRTEGNNPRIKRDKLFFICSGIKKFIGMSGFTTPQAGTASYPLPTIPHMSDQLLSRLTASGLSVPPIVKSGQYLNISEEERESVEKLLRHGNDDGGRLWIAIGPGSKMPAKVWPKERFRDLVQQLIDSHDIWPVVFGGDEDESLGRELLASWGRGYLAAGTLNIRESMAALERCSLYIGNDTGTLHMAAFMGVRCVGLYSARDYPGAWYPYGDDHVVLRHAVPCEGCMLEECTENNMACILSTGVDDVYRAVVNCLNESTK